MTRLNFHVICFVFAMLFVMVPKRSEALVQDPPVASLKKKRHRLKKNRKHPEEFTKEPPAAAGAPWTPGAPGSADVPAATTPAIDPNSTRLRTGGPAPGSYWTTQTAPTRGTTY